jgi:hypothetical protein
MMGRTLVLEPLQGRLQMVLLAHQEQQVPQVPQVKTVVEVAVVLFWS